MSCPDLKLPLALQSHPPVTGVLKWEILESALRSAPEGAPGNRGALGGCSQGVLPRVLNVGRQQKEHSREHSLEHPQFPRALSGAPPGPPRFPGAPSGALPRALSRISHFSTPVTGGWDCNFSQGFACCFCQHQRLPFYLKCYVLSAPELSLNHSGKGRSNNFCASCTGIKGSQTDYRNCKKSKA